MKSDVSEELIQGIASLARLRVQSSELSFYQEELSKIISYVDCLNELSTDVSYPEKLSSDSHERMDEIKDAFDPDLMLANAPKLIGTSFKVPKIIE